MKAIIQRNRRRAAGVIASLLVAFGAVAASPAGPVSAQEQRIGVSVTKASDNVICWESAPNGTSTSASVSIAASVDPCRVSVKVSRPVGVPVTVWFATRDGTARAPADYLPVIGPVTIPPGALAIDIPLSIVRDGWPEPEETFAATISQPSVGQIVIGEVVLPIRDGGPLGQR
jgi:hypothetical protein